MVPAANGTSRTCSSRVCIPNQTARLRITTTTAAVIAESAADNARLPRSRSMNGAPAKIHRKHGRKVTQVVRIAPKVAATSRSEEHTSELQSLMSISYAVFCLKKNKDSTDQTRLRESTHTILQQLYSKQLITI